MRLTRPGAQPTTDAVAPSRSIRPRLARSASSSGEAGGGRLMPDSVGTSAARGLGGPPAHDPDERLRPVVVVVDRPRETDRGRVEVADGPVDDVLAVEQAGDRHRQDHDAGAGGDGL